MYDPNDLTTKFKPGDVVAYDDKWHQADLDYLIYIEGQPGLWVSIVNESWVDRGLRSYAEECIGFFHEGLYKDAIVVGHFGDGSVKDAEDWYSLGKPLVDNRK